MKFEQRRYKCSESDDSVKLVVTKESGEQADDLLLVTRDGTGKRAALAGEHYSPLNAIVNLKDKETRYEFNVGVYERVELEPLAGAAPARLRALHLVSKLRTDFQLGSIRPVL